MLAITLCLLDVSAGDQYVEKIDKHKIENSHIRGVSINNSSIKNSFENYVQKVSDELKIKVTTNWSTENGIYILEIATKNKVIIIPVDQEHHTRYTDKYIENIIKAAFHKLNGTGDPGPMENKDVGRQ